MVVMNLKAYVQAFSVPKIISNVLMVDVFSTQVFLRIKMKYEIIYQYFNNFYKRSLDFERE